MSRYVKYPNVTVQLTGENGNVFNLIAIVNAALRDQVGRDAAKEFSSGALCSKSYEDVLKFITNWVNVK